MSQAVFLGIFAASTHGAYLRKFQHQDDAVHILAASIRFNPRKEFPLTMTTMSTTTTATTTAFERVLLCIRNFQPGRICSASIFVCIHARFKTGTYARIARPSQRQHTNVCIMLKGPTHTEPPASPIFAGVVCLCKMPSAMRVRLRCKIT